VREIARATHGQVIEALIASRLASPSPMVRAGGWARQFAVARAPGLAPGVLNDDRIARAPGALAPVLEQVTGSVGAAAISRFGTGVSQIHWDMTSVSLHGAYEHPGEVYPQPNSGHPEDRRAGLKQVQAGVATAADGAVPVVWQPYNGGAGEVCQVTGAMEAPRKLAGPRRFLLAGDTKLLSYANIAAMTRAEVSFLAPASKAFVPASVLAGCGCKAAGPVNYVAGRDAGRAEASRGRYCVAEDTMTITGPRKKDPSYPLRRVFVHSSANADAAGRARARKLERAAQDLDRLTRGLGSRHYPDAAKAATRIRHRRRPARRRLPACRRRHRPRRPADPAMALRPGRDRRRSRHRRLACAADQPARRRHGRPGPGALQEPARRQRAPLPRPQRTARRRADVPARQPAHHRHHRRHLHGPAHLQPHRAPGPPKPRTCRPARRPLRRPPGQAHRQPHPHRPAPPRLRARAGDRPPEIPQPDPVQQQLPGLLEIDPESWPAQLASCANCGV
jgi:hypothetical protein